MEEKEKSILQDAHEIMHERSEEKTREYGPFDESLRRAAVIASQITGKCITTGDFMKCMVALKISRMRYNIKRDTMMDAVAYIDGLYEYNKEPEFKELVNIAKAFEVKEEPMNLIFELFTKVGNILELKEDDINSLLSILKQMILKDKISTEGIRRQLGQYIPGIYGIMARALNVPINELDDMLRKGKVSSKYALPLLAIELEKAFSNE